MIERKFNGDITNLGATTIPDLFAISRILTSVSISGKWAGTGMATTAYRAPKF